MRSRGVGVAKRVGSGLDSTQVVSSATFLKRERSSVDSAPFETFTLISPEPKDSERSYIDEVDAKWQLRATLQGPKPFRIADSIDQIRRFNDLPDFPNDSAMTSLYQEICDKQYRVMLTGNGGDELFYGSHQYYADSVRGLRVGRIVRRYRDDRRMKAVNPGTTAAWEKLVRFGV